MAQLAEIAHAPTVPTEEETPPPSSAMRQAGRVLIESGAGKTSLALFAIMLAISAYVLLTYPLSFGQERWSNPGVWADNPKTAPPSWMRYLGSDAAEHRVVTSTEPVSEETRGAATIRLYSIPFEIDGTAPSFVSLTLSDLTFNGQRGPLVTATLVRPDGGQLRVLNYAVPGPRADETAPYRRFFEAPERVLLSQQEQATTAVTEWYRQQYPGAPIPADLSTYLDRALFSQPAEGAQNGLQVIPGQYRLDVQLVVQDPNDTIGEMKTVVGGTVFGLMGTDSLGRDLFEGLLYGFPIGLLIAITTSIASTIIGAALGILSGYAGGLTDTVIQRLCDIINNVPTLPLLIFLVFILGSHLYLILLFLVAFSWTGLTIVVRSMVLQLRSGQLVESAKALGASRGRIMMRHVFPQTAPFIVAQMIFFAPGAILAEASLSFIGLGDPSVPTWGQMLEQGFRTGALYVGYWWWVVPPGVLIIFTAVAFMLLALAIEPIVDPRLRQQR